ncbi:MULTISPECIES: TetR/AcrR family transcriptional regulator [unclassified Pseudomonas]|jgi:AcrR family transcriptional regulator|uniref:TetR/AcrR family transcriptional regulator n=1 Tax=unclassified Pseudomonas TaxID=196821 RepID=UPI0013799132|nr:MULTISPECIES: TetR/AcrR family transcriptional regulator [unclassified Pseudomonas]MDQ0668155.1 AcrR family transcriptional regulator [Pseudomonas sp. W2I6]NCE90984.1 TetR/AcrR family transcriptional regulator [Pseudomonas sp. L13]
MPKKLIEEASVRPTRDSDATRLRILNAAKIEFAKLGLGGARIDSIALRAKSNKRMIYEYFGNKEGLFEAVLELAYQDIRQAERKLKLEELEPVEAISKLVSFTWKYYLKNPHFLTLVNSENLHKAAHLKRSREKMHDMHAPMVSMVAEILDRGVAQGVFREGIDPIQLNITIAAINYYYLNNRFTGEIIYGFDLMSPEALQTRIDFNIQTILGMLRPD